VLRTGKKVGLCVCIFIWRRIPSEIISQPEPGVVFEHFLEYLGNIQGTFREHSGNIQGTFREHSENIQGRFREHSGNIQGTFREHSGNIQGKIVQNSRLVPAG